MRKKREGSGGIRGKRVFLIFFFTNIIFWTNEFESLIKLTINPMTESCASWVRHLQKCFTIDNTHKTSGKMKSFVKIL